MSQGELRLWVGEGKKKGGRKWGERKVRNKVEKRMFCGPCRVVRQLERISLTLPYRGLYKCERGQFKGRRVSG